MIADAARAGREALARHLELYAVLRELDKVLDGDGRCTICGTCGPGEGCSVLARHLDWMRQRGLSENTIQGRRRLLARMALPVPLLEADAAMVGEWRAGLTVTGGVIASYVSHVSEFFKWAVKEGLRPGNPAADVPVPKVSRGLPRPVSEDSLMAALAAAPPRIRPWLVLAGWCGLRACEISGLRRENILDTVSPPVLLVAASATKGAHERMVPMSAFVVAELHAARLPPSGFAFRRADGQPGPNAPWMISHLCNEHLHACGIAASLHQLRHRFLTQMWRATHDLRLVQDLAGHSSPATTAGYTEVDKPAAVAAVETLGAPARLRAVR